MTVLNAKYDISVVIPNYNSTNDLLGCLEAIYDQQAECNFEVIVIDSSDIDPSEEIRRQFEITKVFHFNKRTYPGTARNIGVRAAKGNIIAFTDADCIVDSNWLNRIYRVHPGATKVIGGSVKNGYYRNIIATAEYLIEFSEFLVKRHFGFIDLLPTCNFTIPRDTFNDIGGFGDLITAEDTLLSFQLQEAGHNILFDPNISVTHFNRRSLLTYLKKQKELGIGSFLLRKEVRISGSWLTKCPIFSFLVPAIRSFTTARKIIKYDFRQIFIFLLIYPVISLGLFAYALGFWNAFGLTQNRDSNLIR